MRTTPSRTTRLAAILEIAGVFITGTLAARALARAMGVSSSTIRDATPGAAIDYLAHAASTAATLVLRYGITLGLAFLLGWWLARRDLRSYGITGAGLSIRMHVAIAAALFAVGGLLPRILLFAKDHVSLGRMPEHWKVIASGDTFEFWVYMAVGSFGLVPIVEELFFRGYVQTRLGDAFGAPAAIVMTALLFTLSHRQYFLPSVLGISMVVALFVASILAGYVRHRFGTLVPAILAHALGNVPYRGWTQAIVIAAMVAVIVIARRAIGREIAAIMVFLRDRAIFNAAAVAAAVVITVLAIAAAGGVALAVAGVAALLGALWIESRERPATS